ncbi:hypothetical protein ASD25_09480 [Brevundimonas sp. Root1423]|nr:hypothetical protein ASD25_09480 [Brevundimonas sp. Root1423]
MFLGARARWGKRDVLVTFFAAVDGGEGAPGPALARGPLAQRPLGDAEAAGDVRADRPDSQAPRIRLQVSGLTVT